MGRKVFFSFLGAGFYNPTLYTAEGQDYDNIKPTRFIQVSTVSLYCRDFQQHDKIYILTTQGSLTNWNDTEHRDPKTGEMVFYEGLNTGLRYLGLKCHVENIMIKDGKSPDELWEIFRDVFNLIEEGDTLFFDITHGFRSLPMFNMVLINYAKLLKNINVSGIYYGNYEARYTYDDREYSPIWNLKDFQLLNEWTNTANIFLKTGNALPLAEMIGDERGSEIKKGLQLFSKHMLVNRGLDIYKGKDAIDLRNYLKRKQAELQSTNERNAPTEAPLIPILEKINNEFDFYKENNSINGFLAVHWAIRNGLIQQGTTMLEEAVTSFVLSDIGQEQYLNDENKRMTTSAALTIGANAVFNYTMVPETNQDEKENARGEIAKYNLKWEKEFVPVIRNLPYKMMLGKCVNSIKSSIRNDINHAGFRKNARGYDELEASLKKRYSEIRKILHDINKMDLPELN